MNSNSGGYINALIVWGVASAVGFVAMAVLMLVADWTLLQGLFAAAVIFFALGTVLTIGMLRPLPGPVKPGTAGYAYSDAETAPAPQPATPKAPAAEGPAAAAAPEPEPEPEPAPPEPETAPPEPALAPAREGTRPAALDGPRGGQADDLKKIKGIGPKLEKVVNGLGFYHFDQIANWTADEVGWVDENLEGFRGRVTRDDWVAQAKKLAAGEETEFSQRVDKGDVY